MRAAFFDLKLDRAFDYRTTLLDLVDRHRAGGDLLVLVVTEYRTATRGLAPPVDRDPLRIGPDVVLVMDPLADLTGSPPVTVIEAIARLGLDPARCFGYADHEDGLRTLTVVGNPRVFGDDHRLAEVAGDRGWPRLEFSGPSGNPARPPEPVPPAP
ncbi:hypothetical protein ACFW1A_17540 [Kitasatospora sp. NPDC058965]|uniref:hypothetical protein n=1 Tax=Kitasatospora sp. NPDC058965 TaxID=3346682 RepID=UPI003698AE29